MSVVSQDSRSSNEREIKVWCAQIMIHSCLIIYSGLKSFFPCDNSLKNENSAIISQLSHCSKLTHTLKTDILNVGVQKLSPFVFCIRKKKSKRFFWGAKYPYI